MISISSISAADHSGADTVSILDGGADGSVIMETDSSWNNVDAIDGSVIGDAASRLDDVSSADFKESKTIEYEDNQDVLEQEAELGVIDEEGERVGKILATLHQDNILILSSFIH